MLSKLIKLTILITLVGVLAFVIGPCIYFNLIQKPDTGVPDMPSKEDAAYSFSIENTGGLIFSNKYEQQGQVEGSRVFILHGFWEMSGKNFKYVDGDIMLDEAIFGKITVSRRTRG